MITLPLQVRDIMQQKDACNFILVNDRRIRQAFIKDMLSHGAFDHAQEEAKLERQEPSPIGEFLEHPGGSRVGREWDKGAELPVGGDPELVNSRRKGPKLPPAGTARKDCIQQALPELLSLSKVLKM